MLRLQIWHKLIDERLNELERAPDWSAYASLFSARGFFRSKIVSFNITNSSEGFLRSAEFNRLLAFGHQQVPPFSSRRPASSLFRRMVPTLLTSGPGAPFDELSGIAGEPCYYARFEKWPKSPGRLTAIAHCRVQSQIMTFFWISPASETAQGIGAFTAAVHKAGSFTTIDAAAQA